MDLENLKITRTSNYQLIEQMARAIWPVCYRDVLTDHQIQYMLDIMYSYEALFNSSQNGQKFYLLSSEEESLGFYSIQPNFPNHNLLRLHKFYIYPKHNGKGFGRFMMTQIVKQTQEHNLAAIHLNVNRFNPTKEIYFHLGFELIKEENIEIGNGYLMEDYVLQLPLNNWNPKSTKK